MTFDELPAGADAVIVCTPPEAHAECTLRALAAGAAVLVEKPIASTLVDADAIVDAGGRVLYGENLVHSPVVGAAHALVRRIGAPTFLELRFLSPRPSWGSYLEPTAGGGALFDLGVQAVALALLLLDGDPPVAVSATVECPPDLDVDDRAEARLTFRSGAVARIEVDWRSPSMVWDLQVSSDTGVVRTDLAPIAALEHDGEPVELPHPRFDLDPHVEQLGFIAQLQRLRQLVDGGPSAVDAAFGRWVLEIVAAMYAAASDGSTVALPFAGRRDLRPIDHWRRIP